MDDDAASKVFFYAVQEHKIDSNNRLIIKIPCAIIPDECHTIADFCNRALMP